MEILSKIYKFQNNIHTEWVLNKMCLKSAVFLWLFSAVKSLLIPAHIKNSRGTQYQYYTDRDFSITKEVSGSLAVYVYTKWMGGKLLCLLC